MDFVEIVFHTSLVHLISVATLFVNNTVTSMSYKNLNVEAHKISGWDLNTKHLYCLICHLKKFRKRVNFAGVNLKIMSNYEIYTCLLFSINNNSILNSFEGLLLSNLPQSVTVASYRNRKSVKVGSRCA